MSPRPALDCTTCGGRTGELLAYSTPGALFPPRDLGSSGPSSVAFRFFQDLAKDKGCSGSFIRANLLLPPSAFNNSGVARGRESGFGSESAGERLKGRKAKGEKGLGRTWLSSTLSVGGGLRACRLGGVLASLTASSPRGPSRTCSVVRFASNRL